MKQQLNSTPRGAGATVLGGLLAVAMFVAFAVFWHRLPPANMEDTTAAYIRLEHILHGWHANTFLMRAGKTYLVDWDGKVVRTGAPKEEVEAVFAAAKAATGGLTKFDRIQCVQSSSGGLDCFTTIGFEKLNVDVTAGLARDGVAVNVTSLVLRSRPKQP